MYIYLCISNVIMFNGTLHDLIIHLVLYNSKSCSNEDEEECKCKMALQDELERTCIAIIHCGTVYRKTAIFRCLLIFVGIKQTTNYMLAADGRGAAPLLAAVAVAV